MAIATSDENDLGRKLDLLIALTRVGVREQLRRELKAIEDDPVSLAVLRQTSDWIAAGELKAAVKKDTKQSPATISRRIGELVSRGAIQRRGTGNSVSYRSSGLFEV